MTSEGPGSVPVDQVEVRIFTLCDHAAGPPDGKLYINGAGIGGTFLQEIPGPLGVLSLVVRLAIPSTMLGEPHLLMIRVLDPDRNAVGPDPVYQKGFELGRPPGFRVGDESAVQVVVQLTGYPIPREETLRFHLLLDDSLISTLPLKVQRMPAPNVAVLG